jgi:lipid-A-disaccharide synthase
MNPTLSPLDILILSNGPGEVTTWVRPVVRSLRQRFGQDRDQVRISVVLSPCANGTGQEAAIARRYSEVDRVQEAEHFWSFLLWGKTAEQWDWRDRGVVIFLGGDQIFPVIIGKRLGYATVIYGEWETRWHRWVDRFVVMNDALVQKAPECYRSKFTVVGDLMLEAANTLQGESPLPLPVGAKRIGLLPGSKPAKLAQGMPLCLAIAQLIHDHDPTTEFVIPVAPTLELGAIARFADPTQNPVSHYFGDIAATLQQQEEAAYLVTQTGLNVRLWTGFPAYDVLASCQFCLTTVGANTAELAALSVPMIVLLPTQQLDAMRAWDGIPGLLANLPGVGRLFALMINRAFLRKNRLLAWPNIWAGRAIVPELIGNLEPHTVALIALDWLHHPEKREEIRDHLQQVRGVSGASEKLAIVIEELLGSQ